MEMSFDVTESRTWRFASWLFVTVNIALAVTHRAIKTCTNLAEINTALISTQTSAAGECEELPPSSMWNLCSGQSLGRSTLTGGWEVRAGGEMDLSDPEQSQSSAPQPWAALAWAWHWFPALTFLHLGGLAVASDTQNFAVLRETSPSVHATSWGFSSL